MKHTNGPWHVGDQYKIRTDGGAIVALPMSNAARDPEQFQANAHLLAAAPEMLAAIKAFVRCRATCPTVNGNDLVAWDMLLSALAKAEPKPDYETQAYADLADSGGIVDAP